MADNTRASRSNFSALYSLLYDSIDTHIKNASIKLRGWHIWEKWKSQGLRKRMTSYVTVARIIYGKNVNLTSFLKFLYQTFSFLTQYVKYTPHDLDINVVFYTAVKNSDNHTKKVEKSCEQTSSTAKTSGKSSKPSTAKKPALKEPPTKMTPSTLVPTS